MEQMLLLKNTGSVQQIGLPLRAFAPVAVSDANTILTLSVHGFFNNLITCSANAGCLAAMKGIRLGR